MVRAIAKPDIDLPPGKRPPLSSFPSLGALQGILQPPAGFLVEREYLRSIFRRDLMENLDHGVQVLKRIKRETVVAVVHEPFWTAAILGWAGAAAAVAADADGIGLAIVWLQPVLDTDLTAPGDVQVICV
jgi:hypothetical protein